MVRGARVAVSRRFLDFTAHQDLQLSAGLDLDWPKAAKTAAGSSSSKLNTVGLLHLLQISTKVAGSADAAASRLHLGSCVIRVQLRCTGSEAAL
jgi:hypothetical protein